MSRGEFTGRTFSTPEDRCRRFEKIICRYTNPGRPLRVLEIGCGTGSQLFSLAKLLPYTHLTGVDISEANIQVANNSLKQLNLEERLTLSAVDYIKFCTKPFDLIVTYSTLQLIPSSTEDLFSKIAADLTPGGILINSMPYRCLYNQSLYLIRRLFQRIRSPLTDFVVLSIAKILHGHVMSDVMLKERIPYIYALPERHDCSTLRQFLQTTYGLEIIAQYPEPHVSIAQLKHQITVFQKRDRS